MTRRHEHTRILCIFEKSLGSIALTIHVEFVVCDIKLDSMFDAIYTGPRRIGVGRISNGSLRLF